MSQPLYHSAAVPPGVRAGPWAAAVHTTPEGHGSPCVRARPGRQRWPMPSKTMRRPAWSRPSRSPCRKASPHAPAHVHHAVQRVRRPGGRSPHVLQVITIASSCTITTAIGAEGVHGTLQLTEGGKAAFESAVTFTEETTFQASGSITFGEGGHRLAFSTVGQGYLGPSAIRASSREP